MDDIRRLSAMTTRRRIGEPNRPSKRPTTLGRELFELRISEQASTDLAEYATGEATDLRKRLDAAEQRASEERTRTERVEQQLTTVEAEPVASRAEPAGLR